jgi:hypothetical protein
MQGLQMGMRLLESATETVGQVRQKISPSHCPSFLARHMCCDLQTPTVLRHTDRPQLKLVLRVQHIASQREVNYVCCFSIMIMVTKEVITATHLNFVFYHVQDVKVTSPWKLEA